MKLVRPLFVAWLLGLSAGGCTSDLRLALEGKDCNTQSLCVEGYVCNTRTNKCVSPSQLGDGGPAGSAGVAGVAGSSGAGASGAGQGGAEAGHAGFGGNSGLGGGSGAGAGGVGGDDLDGGVDGSDGGDGCVPTTVFLDEDGDTYGDVSETRFACPEPGWVTRAGDCRDDIASVNPGQADFFGEGYIDPTKPGGVSFDYDCVDGEQADQTNNPPTGEPTCTDILDPVSCMGTGYVPDATRTGMGIDPLCGSRVRRDCVVQQLLTCTAVDTALTVDDAFRCR